jgi:hypothetical protein
LTCGLLVANGTATADVSLISEPGVNIATNGCQGLKPDYELQHALYAQAKARLIFKNYESNKWLLADNYQHKLGGTCIGKKTKRENDNGTAAYGEDDLHERYSAVFTELQPADSTISFPTEFWNYQ